ncbi:DNA polymerase III subunit delta [Ligilactobacillus sp. LYQ139]|uniref:DNA polymerase III subunit delta n=1 Tax=Ligilactobacillus sp. LYQ139 TaxID=3378800 RepID=UPI0038525D1F
MDSEQLQKNIKSGTVAPVYLITGNEQYQIDEIHQLFASLIPTEEQGFNLAQYDMATTPIEDAVAAARDLPFMGERRVIIANRADFLATNGVKSKVEHNVTELRDYVINPEPTSVLVLFVSASKLDGRKKVVKTLKKAAVVVETEQLSAEALRQRIDAHLRQTNAAFADQQVRQLFMNRVGNELAAVMASLTKLALLAQSNDGIITRNDVVGMIPANLEEDVFDLTDAVLRGQGGNALQIYQNLIAHREEPVRINAVLLGQFRLLLQVAILKRNGYDQGNIVKTLKVHPYRVKLALQHVSHLHFKVLVQGYHELLIIDERLKTTQQDPKLLFQMFLMRVIPVQAK